jgi:ABC-2 type transport system permease protein
MFIRAIRAELTKQRRSPVWLAFLLVPMIPAAMGTFNYLGNLDVLQGGWYSLWTQHSLFTCYFFLPPLLGVYCSWLCRLEHQNGNWNQLLTSPVPFTALYGAKLVFAAAMVLLTQCWIGVLFILSGKLAGVAGSVPPELLIWLACGAIGGVVISAAQLFLSLLIRSFSVPVGIALMGGIGGLIALTQNLGLFFPYALVSIGMRANAPQGRMSDSFGMFLVSCVAFLLLFSAASILCVKRRDG